MFERILDLTRAQAEAPGRMSRMFRNVFSAPSKAVELSKELDREIQLFHVRTAVSPRKHAKRSP